MKNLFGPSEIMGVELAHHVLKTVTLSVTLRGFHVSAFSRIPLSPLGEAEGDGGLSQALELVKRSWSKVPDWIVTGIGGDRVMTRMLSVPGFRAKHGDSLVKYEMESHLPVDIESVVVDFILRRRLPGGNPTELLASAVRRSDISHCIESFHRSSLDPRLVGACNLGAYFAFAGLGDPGSGDEERVIVDLGGGSVHLVEFDGYGPRMARSLAGITGGLDSSTGEDHSSGERNSGSDSLPVGQSALSRVVREIGLTLLHRESPLAEIILTGDHSSVPGLAEEFQTATGVPCRIWNPLESIPHRVDGEDFRRAPEFASILGTSLSALKPLHQRVDFRQEEFAFRKTSTLMRGKLISLAVLTAVILLTASVRFWLEIDHREREAAFIDRKIRSVYTETFPESRIVVNELHQMASAIEEARTELLALGFHPQRMRMLDLLAALSHRIPPESGIRVTDLSMDAEQFRITGEAGSFESVDILKDRLLDIPAVADVQVEGAGVGSYGKVIEFNLKVTRKRDG